METSTFNHSEAICFQEYRVILKDHGDNKIHLQIINPEKTRMFSSQITKLKQTNVIAVKKGLQGTASQIKVKFSETQSSLQIQVSIQVPFLPLILETISCKFASQISIFESHKISLMQINKNFSECRQSLKSFKEKPRSDILVSLVERIREPYYNQNGDYQQSYGDGTLELGCLNFEQCGKYLLTVSMMADKISILYFYYTNEYGVQTIIFSDMNGNYMDQTASSSVFTPLLMRQVINITNGMKNFRLITYDNGFGTTYQNVILSAEKLQHCQQ